MANDTTDEAVRGEFQALLEEWADAIVANDADRIGAFTEPDWELVTPESGPVPLNRFLGVVRDGRWRCALSSLTPNVAD